MVFSDSFVPIDMMMRKKTFETEVKTKLMKKTDPSGNKRERSSLFQFIFLKLKKEDVV